MYQPQELFDKSVYLNSSEVAEFIGFVARLLDGEPFRHEFVIRDRKLPSEYLKRFGPIFQIDAVEQAADRYFWDSGDFLQNKSKLEAIERIVRNAIASEGKGNALEATLNAVDCVLEWGAGGKRSALYKSNVDWAHSKGNDLIALLQSGRREMESAKPDVSIFRTGPRMNAGFTKYYALACKDVVIYDGRVGAAMGLLARNFLEQRGLPTSVPTNLAFRWGRAKSGRNRNPSSGALTFSEFNGSSFHWAHSNFMANWILTAAQKKASTTWCKGQDGLRRIEASLFMIGYDLPI